MRKLIDILLQCKLIKWGLNGNTWVWFHILGGGVLARFLMLFGWSDVKIMVTVTVVALLWEVFEFFYDGGFEGMIHIYGSLDRWFWDSVGDFTGTVFCALVVVSTLWGEKDGQY